LVTSVGINPVIVAEWRTSFHQLRERLPGQLYGHHRCNRVAGRRGWDQKPFIRLPEAFICGAGSSGILPSSKLIGHYQRIKMLSRNLKQTKKPHLAASLFL